MFIFLLVHKKKNLLLKNDVSAKEYLFSIQDFFHFIQDFPLLD